MAKTTIERIASVKFGKGEISMDYLEDTDTYVLSAMIPGSQVRMSRSEQSWTLLSTGALNRPIMLGPYRVSIQLFEPIVQRRAAPAAPALQGKTLVRQHWRTLPERKQKRRKTRKAAAVKLAQAIAAHA